MTALRDEAQRALPAMRNIGGLRSTRVLAVVLGALLVFVILGLTVVPWQQNLPASGRVIAFAPYDRMQTISAPVMGRVQRTWVSEGSRVKKGDPLVEIVDNDPDIIQRLGQQKTAMDAAVAASHAKVAVYNEQVRSLTDARELSISAAKQQVEVAIARAQSEEHGLEAAEATARQAALNHDRQTDLFSEGLASRADLELAERVDRESRAKVEQARQALKAAKNDLESKRADTGRVDTEAKAKIDAARAQREAANVEVAAKEKELSELDVKINQQSTQLVRAPRDGTVLRVAVSPGAELVGAGDPLVVLVPETDSRAVELWVSGNDVPLIEPGDPVRIQFEGWPAVQFAGWPSVAVGTFGGRVEVVDTADDGTGRFRIVVLPDDDDDPWPHATVLRQGARARGFVLLDEVSLGYELWRLANGFPPTVEVEDGGTGSGAVLKKKGAKR